MRLILYQRGNRLTPRLQAFFSLQVACTLVEGFPLLAFGHLLQFASVAFACVASLSLVAL